MNMDIKLLEQLVETRVALLLACQKFAPDADHKELMNSFIKEARERILALKKVGEDNDRT